MRRMDKPGRYAAGTPMPWAVATAQGADGGELVNQDRYPPVLTQMLEQAS